MWHLGIDLHRRTVVLAAVHDSGQAAEPQTFGCQDTNRIIEHVRGFKPFRAVIEATSTYRWLYELLSREGTILLAHPAKLRLMIQHRTRPIGSTVSSWRICCASTRSRCPTCRRSLTSSSATSPATAPA